MTASDSSFFEKGVSSPVRNAEAVTPHDSNELSAVTRAVYIGGAGNLECILADDSVAVIFAGLSAGQILPIRAKVIKAGSTTATSILALY